MFTNVTVELCRACTHLGGALGDTRCASSASSYLVRLNMRLPLAVACTRAHTHSHAVRERRVHESSLAVPTTEQDIAHARRRGACPLLR